MLEDLGAGAAWSSLPSGIKRAEPLSGMFAGLFAVKTRAWPTMVKTDTQRTRNSVIHGDHIPTEEEALRVACDVLKSMRAVRDALPDILAGDEYGAAATARMAQYGAEYMKNEDEPRGWKQMMTIGYTVRLDLEVGAEVAAIRKESFPELVR